MNMPIKSDKPPTDLFNDLIASTSSPVETCEFCGRTFFEDDSRLDWEPGEYEALKLNQKTSPEKFYAMSHVACGTINGKSGVIGCPCNWGQPFENFIWTHRRFIMEYISARVRKVVERALEDEGAAEEATTDLEREKKAVSTVRCEKCLKFVSEIAVNDKGVCIKCVEQEQISKLASPKMSTSEEMKKQILEAEEHEFEKAAWDSEDNNLPF